MSNFRLSTTLLEQASTEVRETNCASFGIQRLFLVVLHTDIRVLHADNLFVQRNHPATTCLSSSPTSLRSQKKLTDIMDEAIGDLILAPFRDIVAQGKFAIVNAAEGGDDEMLKAAQSLVKEGERALKKIEPLCQRKFEEHGPSFVDAVKDDSMYIPLHSFLHAATSLGLTGFEMRYPNSLRISTTCCTISRKLSTQITSRRTSIPSYRHSPEKPSLAFHTSSHG